MNKIVPFGVVIWTLVALILHFSEVGKFATWNVAASPFSWSCLCVFFWWLIVIVVLTVINIICRAIYENSDEARIRRMFKR